MAIYPNILRTFANSRVIVPCWRQSGLRCLEAGTGTVCPITDFTPDIQSPQCFPLSLYMGLAYKPLTRSPPSFEIKKKQHK